MVPLPIFDGDADQRPSNALGVARTSIGMAMIASIARRAEATKLRSQ
jgi:hypothetical protein